MERQHGRGKLTARERIDCLLDQETFSELGSSVNTTGKRIDGREFDAPCDGAVMGTGRIEGRRVAVYASDFTVLGGSIGTQHGTQVRQTDGDGRGLGNPHDMAPGLLRRTAGLPGCAHGRDRLVVCPGIAVFRDDPSDQCAVGALHCRPGLLPHPVRFSPHEQGIRPISGWAVRA